MKSKKIRCPIPRAYRQFGKKVVISQPFGANKNKCFGTGEKEFCYGPQGHDGIDIVTKGNNKYEQINTWNWIEEDYPIIKKDKPGFKLSKRDKYEKRGRIKLKAAIEGKIEYILLDDKAGSGWGLSITSGDYRCKYWHIESPWGSWKNFKGWVTTKIKDLYASRGEYVAIAGNSGDSTGAHLHFELQEKKNGQWKEIDPLPHFTDSDVVWYVEDNNQHWYQGEKISEEKSDEMMDKMPSYKL